MVWKTECNIPNFSIFSTRKWGIPISTPFRSPPKCIHPALNIPKIKNCEGIYLSGISVKSILFSTDMLLIENRNADAILAVYRFLHSSEIIKSLINFFKRPMICGIGGSIAKKKTAIEMVKKAEKLKAYSVVVNQPFPNSDVKKLKEIRFLLFLPYQIQGP